MKARLVVCMEYDGMIAHHKYLSDAGPACHSEDETDDEDNTELAQLGVKRKITKKRVPYWRSRTFSRFLWRLDDMVEELKADKIKRKSGLVRGYTFRIRNAYENTQPSETHVPKGLHRNCYDEEFRKGIPTRQMRQYAWVDEDYDFALPDEAIVDAAADMEY